MSSSSSEDLEGGPDRLALRAEPILSAPASGRTRLREAPADEEKRLRGAPTDGHLELALQSISALIIASGFILLAITASPTLSAVNLGFLALGASSVAVALFPFWASWRSKARFAQSFAREIAQAAEAARREHDLRMEQARSEVHAERLAQGEYLASVVHEIRAPLGAILGSAQVLREDGDLAQAPASRLATIEAIERHGDHLLAVANDLLDLTQIEAGRMTVELLPTNLVRILADVELIVLRSAQEKGLLLEFVAEGSLPEFVRVDPTRLRQILLNLVGNAIKFTETGLVRLVTSWNSRGPTPELRFEVIDTGIGMTPEQTETLFLPFSQAADSIRRKFGGSGLGLAICQRLAELLGGAIQVVETSPGKGTRFRATIAAPEVVVAPPNERTVEIGVSAKSRRMDSADSSRDGQLLNRRVLIADDDKDNQRLISFFLEKAGAQVSVVSDGRQAVDAALAAENYDQPFDAILMDLQMPLMDGLQATGVLRAEGYRRPIIALSACALKSERAKCWAAGCSDFAAKPIERRLLVATIRRQIGLWRESERIASETIQV